MQKNEIDPYFIALTRINSLWIKELNIRPETVKHGKFYIHVKQQKQK